MGLGVRVSTRKKKLNFVRVIFLIPCRSHVRERMSCPSRAAIAANKSLIRIEGARTTVGIDLSTRNLLEE